MKTPWREVASARDDPSARPVAVVELLQEFDLPGNGRLFVIGADIWTTWFEIRWLLRHDSDLYDQLFEYWWDIEGPGRWWAEDNHGHRYDCLMGAGGGGNGKWFANLQLAPGLDQTAQKLTLHIPIPPDGEVALMQVVLPVR